MINEEIKDRNSKEEQVTLGITGMTCAACSNRVEKNLSKVDGVSKASVNPASEKASVSFNPSQTSVEQLMATVKKTGYGVREAKASLAITGMTCAACATRIEKGLNKVAGLLMLMSIWQTKKQALTIFQAKQISIN